MNRELIGINRKFNPILTNKEKRVKTITQKAIMALAIANIPYSTGNKYEVNNGNKKKFTDF